MWASSSGRATRRAPTLRARRAAPWLAACSAAAGCSLILDFGGSSESEDAGSPDASAPSACDRLEPNDSLETARTIDPDVYELGLCHGTEADFFAFSIGSGQELAIDVAFEADEGRHDLELELYDREDEESLETAESENGAVAIQRGGDATDALDPGEYAVEVRMSESVADPLEEALYELTLAID